MVRVSRPRPTGIVAMAAAVAFSSWLILDYDRTAALPVLGSSSRVTTTETGTTTPPVAGVMTAAELRTSARALGRPVYWGGPRPGAHYELSRDPSSDAVILNYLAAGAGAEQPAELTVATIPLADAFGTTETLAAQPGAVAEQLPDGGLAWSPGDRPLTAYVAHPGVDYVIEVTAPRAGLARDVAFSGRVAPL